MAQEHDHTHGANKKTALSLSQHIWLLKRLGVS